MDQKTKVDQQYRFFLRIFSPTHFDPWKCLKKFLVGGVVGGLSKYSVYSWPSFVKVKARFGQICD